VKADAIMRRWAPTKRAVSWVAKIYNDEGTIWKCVHDHPVREEALICALRARELLLREAGGEALEPRSAE
jgi:hypothetical protein